jgi:prostamide/prostaglandin F2alpha synthase
LSSITSLLQDNQVKNIAVGLEELGLDDFVKGGFFNGDLYVDVGKKTYKAMGYKKLGYLEMMGGLLSKAWKDKVAKNKEGDNLPYDFKGDGWQNGGTLVVAKGGEKVLLNYKQDNAADHVDAGEVLKVLGIAAKAAPAGPSGEGASKM